MINVSRYSVEIVKEESKRYDLPSKQIGKPKDVSDLLKAVFKLDKRAEEMMIMIALDTKNKIIGVFTVAQGILNSCTVHPREIFKRAIVSNSANIIIAHNHPSGDPNPSKEDINLTLRIKECGKLLGIELLDHIIIGEDRFISLMDKNLI